MQKKSAKKKCAPHKKSARKMAVKRARESKAEVRSRLAEVKESDPALPLPEFVESVNEIAECYLPPREPVDGRVKSEFSERTVRHYQGKEIIDAPEKDGKEARYRYRHVLQAVLTRVMLADGFRGPKVREMLAEKTDGDYEELLEMGPMMARKMARGRRGPREERQVFVRLEVVPGLEVHIARGFTPPETEEERADLHERLSHTLRDEMQHRRRRARRWE